ncbi:MAG: VCBS repeat-containing protein [Candidatus Eisenbacteria bacterium]|nr:VCBS repeat-containing protein [Candidatus Eisenbacteria bacterium]
MHRLPPLGVALLVGLALPCAAPALDYVESSQGLVPPSWEGGRTELEFSDVDADGNVDLVSIGDHGSPYINTDEHGIMVWFGDGRGAWSVYQSGNFGYGGIALGDINNDGLIDAAYGMHHNYSSNDFGDQILEAALGDGTGKNWIAWDDGLATSGEDWGMFCTDLADIDNDGDLDIGSNSFGCCAGVHVYRNHGDGTWTQSFGFLGGNSGMEFIFGDINADGFMDFVAANQTGTVYLGDGSGDFANADGNLPGGSSTGRNGPSLGDIDNDGDLDIAFKGSSASLEVWLWNGIGNWIRAADGLPSSGIATTQLNDMNGDGWLDVIGLGNGVLRIWLGDGGATWTQAAQINFPSPGTWSALRVGGDVDHNGLPDIAAVTKQGNFPSDYNRLRVFRESSQVGALTARFVSPRGGERLAGGSIRFIDWMAAVPPGEQARAAIELSAHGPEGPWIPVADGLPDGGRYQWRVPVVAETDQAFLRLRVTVGAEIVETTTPRAFSILPPTAASIGEWTGGAGDGALAFPNPSGGGVRLLLSGGREEIVRVHDTGGRLVRVLHGAAPVWDGRDERGGSVPAGVYCATRGGKTVRVVRLR